MHHSDESSERAGAPASAETIGCGREQQERDAARARRLAHEAAGEPPAPWPDVPVRPGALSDIGAPVAPRDGADARVSSAEWLMQVAFRALGENVRDYAIFLMRPDGVITFWGEGARLMKWWSKEEAEGAHLRLLYPDGGSEDGTAEAHLIEAAERGEYTGEGQRVRSDGSTFWAGVTLTPLRDQEGRLLGFGKVTRDLTARRAADALLQSARDAADQARLAAEDANRAKSGFLATMSHEIRTPLNAVLGYLELVELEIAGPLTPDQARYIARARTSSHHLLSLIDDILDLSRMEARHVSVDRTASRIGTSIEGALALVEPQARARELALVNAVAGEAAGLAYWGDEERVRQILTNLLSNGVKFTDPGGRVTVSAGMVDQLAPDVSLNGPGPWVYVRVEDTGMGIEPGRMRAIFEPFVQADMTLTRRHGGTGLGLAISRELARLMNGDLTVRSAVNAGSTFFLWLPAAPAESLATGGVEGAREPGGSSVGEPGSPIRTASKGARSRGILREIGETIVVELERILHAYVARLRSDPQLPSARQLSEQALEDHLATFLADVAQTLASIDAAGRTEPGSMDDSAAIQRVVAARHGQQRARLGWSVEELRREYQILGEELTAAIRRHAPRGRTEEAERALFALREFITHAEGVSVGSFIQSVERGTGDDDRPR